MRSAVLLSSAGRRVALIQCFRHALAELGVSGRVITSDRTRLSAACQLGDATFQVPECVSPDFIPVMLGICQREEVALVVPTIDTELPTYAAAKGEFEKCGTVVAVSGPLTVAIGGDKTRTQAWLRDEGFPTVAQASVDEVRANWESWQFPLVVKPAAGSASIGVRLVSNLREFDLAAEVSGAIVQRVAQGFEYTIDVLVDRAGRATCAVPRRRLEVRAGEVSKAMTVRDSRLITIAMEIAERLPDAYGVLNIQIFLDHVTGTMNVIEVNPRFGGGFPLTHEAGGRYARWMLEETLGVPSTASRSDWREGLVMLRFDDAVFVSREDVGL